MQGHMAEVPGMDTSPVQDAEDLEQGTGMFLPEA